ncbi:hypothetical protein AAHB65_03705 [Bacillus toyonensis]
MRKKILQLLETGEIPSLNSGKVTDAISFNVLNNVMEGLFRLSKNDEVIEAGAQNIRLVRMERLIHFIYVMRNGLTEIQ